MSDIKDQFNAKALYDIYTVTIKLRERIYGGTPKTQELIESWIKARTGHNDALTEEQVEVAKEVVGEEMEERSWVGFQEDIHGLFLDANNVKAMLKQSGSMLGYFVKKRGTKQIMKEGMEVKSEQETQRIYFGRKEPDGRVERPIHTTGPAGPRTALKRADYLEGVEFSFFIWVLKTPSSESRHVGYDELVRILTFSQENGIGADRSQGAGKFDVVDFKLLDRTKAPKKKPNKKTGKAA